MLTDVQKRGLDELRSVRSRSKGLYLSVGLFSMFANLLMLTGPLYMLQVYDRVLGSGSEETLIALSLIVVFLYMVMGLLDFIRGRMMARIGARFQADLDRRVFDAVLRKSAVAPDAKTSGSLQDLESIQRFIMSPALIAAFDIPWVPIFFAAIFIFHPILGWLAVVGALALIVITIGNQIASRDPQAKAAQASQNANGIAEQIRVEAEMVQAMGMRDAAFIRWQQARGETLNQQLRTTDVSGTFTSLSKTLRLFLQSAMLGVGAWLVLQDEMTAGAMIAGSILLGRALAPIEAILTQWATVQRARAGWENLAELLGTVAPEAFRTTLPMPKAHMVADALVIYPPGEKIPALKSVSFSVAPGQAVGVIGASGAGKTALARALTGLWRPASGSLRLDGASLAHYGPEVLGQHIGYLPQRVQLFDGTIAENISRLSSQPSDDKVVAAAKLADAHEMILKLPEGYDTLIRSGQTRLSGGQIQRIGLARALFNSPVIVVLDEPNSNLDSIGSNALNKAIRQLKADNRAVFIMAHRPAAIQECDMVLVLEAGRCVAFGPTVEVLAGTVENHAKINKTARTLGSVV